MKIINRILMAGLFSFIMISAANAATFTVKNTLDDLNPGSLRWAITQANANTDFDMIEFHIPSANPNDPPQQQIIEISSPLGIGTPMLIDGWSQVGEGVVGVQISGKILIDQIIHIGFSVNDVSIRGLALGGNVERGIKVKNSDRINIYGNHIGFGLDGETRLDIQWSGIHIERGKNIIIGGYSPNERNVIYSGGSGVFISSASAGVNIIGNMVGLTRSEKALVVNDFNFMRIGVAVNSSDDVLIEKNIIGGLQSNAFSFWSSTICDHFVGICAEIYGNNLRIFDNFIGIASDGKTARPNDRGVLITSAIKGVSIKKNVVSGNRISGIEIRGNSSGGSMDISISDNIIGLSSKGDWILADNGDVVAQPFGVRLDALDGMILGEGNIISGNVNGVFVTSSVGVKIEGNTIGLGLDKITPYPNKAYGVHFTSSVFSEIRNNTIAFNGVSGVGIAEFSRGVAILNNRIFNNTSLGIDLIPNGGVTLNDEGDFDAGSNDLLNFPELRRITLNPFKKSLSVKLVLDIDAPSAIVQFFSNPSGADPTGHGEGEIFIGQATVPASPFVQAVTVPLVPNGGSPLANISATATVTGKGTSEFSKTFDRALVLEAEDSGMEAIPEKWIAR